MNPLQEIAQRLEGRDLYAVIADAIRLTEPEGEMFAALSQEGELNPRELRARCPAVWGLSGVAQSLNRKLERAGLNLEVVVDVQRRGQGQVSSTWKIVSRHVSAA
jgi:hypothetical protein